MSLVEHSSYARPRLRAMAVLAFKRSNVEDAVLLEREIHAASVDKEDYEERCKTLLHAFLTNPSLGKLGKQVCHMSDEQLMEGTVVQTIQREQKERFESLHHMLEERHEMTRRANDSTFIKCRKCGGNNITFTQKQTRSADEAMTVFLECLTCKERWRS